MLLLLSLSSLLLLLSSAVLIRPRTCNGTLGARAASCAEVNAVVMALLSLFSSFVET